MSAPAVWAKIGMYAANGLLAVAALLLIQPARSADQLLPKETQVAIWNKSQRSTGDAGEFATRLP
jgi:hypothetical protein